VADQSLYLDLQSWIKQSWWQTNLFIWDLQSWIKQSWWQTNLFTWDLQSWIKQSWWQTILFAWNLQSWINNLGGRPFSLPGICRAGLTSLVAD
jgi:hypothetical protein